MFRPLLVCAFLLALGPLFADEPLRRIEVDPAAGQAGAVVVDGVPLLHTAQLMNQSVAQPSDQFDQVLKRLDGILEAHRVARKDVVKLNLYVDQSSTRIVVQRKLAEWFGNDLPAVSYVETPLPLPEAKVALDAVVALEKDRAFERPVMHVAEDKGACEWAILPRGDVVYISGQAEPGDLATATRKTLEGLRRTLKHLELGLPHVVSMKCFVQPMSEIAVVNRELRAFFGEGLVPPVSHVEWNSGGYPIEIELVAHAPAAKTDETISFAWLPWLDVSPVYCRLTRIHGDKRIYTSGIVAESDGDGAAQVRGVFATLAKWLDQSGSDMKHLAKATYYVSDDDASKQLNLLRPEIYDPKRPPAASKAMVRGVAAAKRGISLDMIAAPKSLTESAALPWKAGVASTIITPGRPMMMAGFASRTMPAEGKATELMAKALVLEDAVGKQLAIVTYDLIGVPRPLRERIEQRVAQQFGISPSHLMINASHTHCGPELAMSATALEELSEERRNHCAEYTRQLEDKLVALIGNAQKATQPAELRYSHARCGFAMNRRLKNPDPAKAVIDPYLNHPNPDGPVDHDVPVLQVVGSDGKPRAVVFGYACHNTTLFFNQYAGDYAGYAQQFIEEDHPGVTALFITGCGGDQNGYPRGTVELSQKHGRSLATAVDAAMLNRQRAVRGPIEAQFDRTEIEYEPALSKEQLAAVAAGKPDDAGIRAEMNPDHAKRLLRHLERDGKLRTSYDYPIQTIRFGDDLLLIGLSGEVVVDYSLRLKRELAGAAAVWVGGYCNDVFAYIPSKRVLEEGGYEPKRSMNYMTGTVQPGPFAPTIEERIIGKVKEMVGK